METTQRSEVLLDLRQSGGTWKIARWMKQDCRFTRNVTSRALCWSNIFRPAIRRKRVPLSPDRVDAIDTDCGAMISSFSIVCTCVILAVSIHPGAIAFT